MPNTYEIHATGPDETRSLRLSKEGDHYRIVIWWGKGERALATLNFTEAEWIKLSDAARELEQR